ncbi:ubiquitin-specific protease doa4 [Microbotryomycetes sp. JL201]|nr:ubiquitin-specific protease doa4 [Microbotryomycetes sp. JL201]
MAATRLPPTPLAKLKERSALKLHNTHEYSVRTWLNAARDSLERGLALWRAGQQAHVDPTKVEDAFMAMRQGAEQNDGTMVIDGEGGSIILCCPQQLPHGRTMSLYKLASAHPKFNDVSPSDKAHVKQLLIEANTAQTSVVDWLQQRESDYVKRHGPIPSPSTLASRVSPGASQRPLPSINGTNTSNALFGSSANSPALARPSAAVSTQPATSPPLSSIKDRMAALRAKGMVDVAASPAASAEESTRIGHADASLSIRNSPPATPKPQAKSRGDLVEDTAMQRSGSAPPAIPVNDEQDLQDEGAFSSLGLELSNNPPPSAQRGTIPSPTDMNSFPSLDDFERSLPSTNGSASANPTRSPLPPPPRPFEMDLGDFESQRRSHADAVARLGGVSSTFQQGLSTAIHKALPPPGPSATAFTIPFTSEVGPQQLYSYLSTTQAEKGKGPRVLLLDVRNRDEFDHGRIIGETVCLEPIVLRSGITSAQIESALSLSPKHEQDMFSARGHYDMIVIYDRASTSLPGVEPPSTAPELQRTLWNLVNAIYEREFYKHLKRQPVLLKGGWEGWEKYVGGKGITVDGVTPLAPSTSDAKKEHRRAAVLPATSASNVFQKSLAPLLTGPLQSGSNSSPSAPPQSYFPASSDYLPERPAAGSSVLSPRLAMPPTAVRRSGSTPVVEGYSQPAYSSSSPQYPHQPSINGFMSSSSLVRSRGDYGDLHAVSQQQSFEPYTRPSIDYPQLQSRPSPLPPRPTRPPPIPDAVTRPPAAQPAPERSSSGSYVPIGTYSAHRSAFPTLMNFDDNVIGLTGLKNLGNTCYMNSTVQCLSAAVPFARYFKDRTYRRDVNTVNPHGTRGALADAVSELIRAIWAQNYTFLAPITFRENICRFAPQFKGSDQHDAQEFLGFLLDGLHEDLNYVVKKPPPIEMTPDREHDLETLPPQIMSEREWEIYRMRDDSFVVQCFQGQFRNQLKCLTCGKTSTTYNTFMPLSIPIPSGRGASKATLEECISAFVREEILDKDDAWFCPKCKTNRRASKRLTLSRLPPILVIHLKRFSFRGPFSDKVETQVQYPLTGLDLTHYLPPPLFDQRTTPKGKVYDLFGVTNHYGNLSSGHYTAFVRSGREWHNIGDSKVTQVDPKVVEGAKSAYILYYALR